jgi:hypothetical protein
MKTSTLIAALIALVIVLGGIYAFTMRSGGASEPQSAATSSPVVIPEAGQVVQDFGAHLRNVSLLAPAAALKAAMDENYGPYIAPELLAQWEADPSKALGRETSSPYPARIQIGQQGAQDDVYVVYGTVVDVAQGQGGEEIVGTYPVEFALKQIDGRWMIYSAVKGDYSQIPARTTITGTYECLPHRDTTGPQTMECAFGIRDANGKHYALNTQLMASSDWMSMPTGTAIIVEGVLVPVEQLNSDQWQRYDIVGIISATSIIRR